jgi:hypothetical protein
LTQRQRSGTTNRDATVERWLDRFLLKCRSLFQASRVEAELDEELRFHLDQQIEQLVAGGMSRDQARRTAVMANGSCTNWSRKAGSGPNGEQASWAGVPKFYELTRPGRRHLEREAANWERLSSAISAVVRLKEA